MARMKTGKPATVKWVSVPQSANSPFGEGAGEKIGDKNAQIDDNGIK